MEGREAGLLLPPPEADGGKAPPDEILKDIPAAFIAYDCLARSGAPLFESPWSERRRHLEEIAASWDRMHLSEVSRASNAGELEALFAKARAAGNEGLMLKRFDSLYQAGKRGKQWRKWKKALATLDVVVTAVEQGHGKRAGMLSDYTFAVRDGDRLVNIGKAYSGPDGRGDPDHGRPFPKDHDRSLRSRPRRAPEVVIEVAFDTIQESNRHKSGFALRFPRIVRLRPDKTPEQATTLDEVRQLYASIAGPLRRRQLNPVPVCRAVGEGLAPPARWCPVGFLLQHHPEVGVLKRRDVRRLLVDRSAPVPPSVFSK